MRSSPSPQPSQPPPSITTSPPPSPPLFSPQNLPQPPMPYTDPPPATVLPPLIPPVSSPPPTNSPPPSSQIPPTTSPSPTSSPPSTRSLPPPANPTTSSPSIPPPLMLSPPPSIVPARKSPYVPPPPILRPPPSSTGSKNPPPIPPPPMSSPSPSLVPARKSPYVPSQPILSPPPSIQSKNAPSFPPPPIMSPPPLLVPRPYVPPPPSPPQSLDIRRNSPSTPHPPSLTPNGITKPPPPILNPPPSPVPPKNPPYDSPTLPHPGPTTNSLSPPVITIPPPFTNPSTPPVIIAPPPFFRQVPPSSHPPSLAPSGNSYTPPRRPSNSGGIGTGGIVGISTVLGVILIASIITVLWCLIKRKKKNSEHNGLNDLATSMGNSPRSNTGLLKIKTSSFETGNLSSNEFYYSAQEPGGLGNSRLKFTYEDLVEATNGFSQRNLIGSGGFGYVYKGFLADGMEVAVKELKTGSRQGEREFTAEVEIISRIHHRYLVSLVGYCISGNKRLLVYEYVPNNTLYYHLHVPQLVLDWPTRIRVASGAARGIAYLHEDCHPRVIHRDIKSSNILLDENFDARVSDFGLAKLAADVNTHVTTRVMGTFGYMAPEYASSGKLSEKSDVFSFGVVLLELITGRKPVDVSLPLGDEGLVEWARPLLSHALETQDFKLLVDPALGMNFVPNEIFRMIEAAAACIRHAATKRPRMGQIVRAFENLETEDLSNGLRLGESEIYNSAQQLFQRMDFDGQDYSTDFSTQASRSTDSKEM